MTIKLGCDLGQSSIKFVGAQGSTQFLSQAALYGGEVADFGRRRKKPVVVEGDFGKLYVGYEAHSYGIPVENLDFDRLAGTNEMRAIFYGAMTEYMKKHGVFSEPLVLIVGLPLQMLIGESGTVAKFRASVYKWLGGEHSWYADGEMYYLKVEQVHPYPQAMGAAIDYALDMNGESRGEEQEKALSNECAAISIGSNTVELMVTKRSKDTKNFCIGKAIGVRQLWRRVDPHQWYSFGEFDEMLRSSSLPPEMDVKPHLESWMSEITGFANSVWGQAYHRFHKVFLVGGGAILLKSQLRNKFNRRGLPSAVAFLAINYRMTGIIV